MQSSDNRTTSIHEREREKDKSCRSRLLSISSCIDNCTSFRPSTWLVIFTLFFFSLLTQQGLVSKSTRQISEARKTTAESALARSLAVQCHDEKLLSDINGKTLSIRSDRRVKHGQQSCGLQSDPVSTSERRLLPVLSVDGSGNPTGRKFSLRWSTLRGRSYRTTPYRSKTPIGTTKVSRRSGWIIHPCFTIQLEQCMCLTFFHSEKNSLCVYVCAIFFDE